MEQINRGAEFYCLGCLCSGNEYKIQEYENDHFKAILDVASLKLCYLCRAMAEHADLFMWNVHCNQSILENYLKDRKLSSLAEMENKGPPPIDLSLSPTLTDSVQDNESDNSLNSEGSFTHIVAYTAGVIQTELLNDSSNIKEEITVTPETNSVVASDDELTSCEELEVLESDYGEEGEYNKTGRRNTGKNKTTRKELRELAKKKDEEDGIEMVHITLDQCMEERRLKALEPSYLACPFKCKDCVIGFALRPTYENHWLQRHSVTRGPLVCSVCNTRHPTRRKLIRHMRTHTIRYRCLECGLSFLGRATAAEHVLARHRPDASFECPHCYKRFKRHDSYRNHVKCVHENTDRHTCNMCDKTLSSKMSLRQHMVSAHAALVGAVRAFRCAQCPATFKILSELKAHATVHSDHRPYYCVECDKRFKTTIGLRRHFKNSKFHDGTYEKSSCPQCHKWFSSERSRDRHVSTIHLNYRPHKCPICDKGYLLKFELRKHMRTHEGLKPPRPRKEKKSAPAVTED